MQKDEGASGIDPVCAVIGCDERVSLFLSQGFSSFDRITVRETLQYYAMDAPVQLIERNADYLVLTLQSVDEKAADVVGKMSFEPELTPHKDITIRVARTGDVRLILNAMKDAGASFLSMDVRKPNLEEVFLKLTGEALHEGACGGKGVK